jgi:hypothetical protein
MYNHNPNEYLVDVELAISLLLVKAVVVDLFERSTNEPNVVVVFVKYLYKTYIKIIMTIPKMIAVVFIFIDIFY